MHRHEGHDACHAGTGDILARAEALCRERRPDARFDGFEAPEKVDLTVALDQVRLDDAVDMILGLLEKRK